jgi:small-conductance mechanosensitive channel
MVSENVINWSHSGENTRFAVEVGVAYGTDTDLVIRLCSEVMNKHPKVSQGPKPFVRLWEFGEHALVFQCLFWSEEIFRIENVKSDIRLAIDKAFRENNITIPFPQRDLHIKTGLHSPISPKE